MRREELYYEELKRVACPEVLLSSKSKSFVKALGGYDKAIKTLASELYHIDLLLLKLWERSHT